MLGRSFIAGAVCALQVDDANHWERPEIVEALVVQHLFHGGFTPRCRIFLEPSKQPEKTPVEYLGRDNQNRTGTSPVTGARRYQLTLSLLKIFLPIAGAAGVEPAMSALTVQRITSLPTLQRRAENLVGLRGFEPRRS